MTARNDTFGAQKKIGGLFTGWAVVTGLAATFATAVYASTGDQTAIVMWIGFPTAVFTLLMVLTGMAVAATQTATSTKRRRRPMPGEGIRHTRRQTPWGMRR